MRPTTIGREVKHEVFYHINTTPGPLTFCKPRRLSPEMFKIARAEFEILIRLGYIRPSENQWSSALHMVAKGEGGR